MKPGAFLLAMGATRTYHNLASDIESCGFQIKDCLIWAYTEGFPRGKDIGKQITDAENSQKWNGWNTTLKPSYEPIVVASKRLEGNYVENVLKYNVGGINIDECRIPYESEEDMKSIGSFDNFAGTDRGDSRFFSANTGGKKQVNINPKGRYPANLVYFDSLFPGTYDKFFMVPKPSNSEKIGLTHDTVKPFKLFHRLIKMFSPKPSIVKSNVVVLDPFCGTATTGIACMDLGRDFIGFEIDAKICEEAKCRIKNTNKKIDLFES